MSLWPLAAYEKISQSKLRFIRNGIKLEDLKDDVLENLNTIKGVKGIALSSPETEFQIVR